MTTYLWIVLLFTAQASAATTATILDSDLTTKRITIQSLYDGRLSYFGADRQLRSARLDRFMQIRILPAPSSRSHNDANPSSAPAQQVTAVELVDGQKLFGRWVDVDDDGQTLIFEHELLGQVAIALDTIGAVAQGRPVPDQKGSHQDMVSLANGDTLTGWVIALHKAAVEFQSSGASEPVTLPLSRAPAMRLANSALVGPFTSHLIWFTDASRVRVTSLQMVQDQLTCEPILVPAQTSQPPTRTFTIALNKVSRIDLASSQGQLVQLVSLKMTRISGGSVFGVNMPPQFAAAEVHLHAPVVVRFDLPAGAKRFAAVAALDLNEQVSHQARSWANVDLIIRVGKRIVGRHHLSSEHRQVRLNVPLQGRSLTIEVDTASNGPVLDRVVLYHPIVYMAFESK